MANTPVPHFTTEERLEELARRRAERSTDPEYRFDATKLDFKSGDITFGYKVQLPRRIPATEWPRFPDENRWMLTSLWLNGMPCLVAVAEMYAEQQRKAKHVRH